MQALTMSRRNFIGSSSKTHATKPATVSTASSSRSAVVRPLPSGSTRKQPKLCEVCGDGKEKGLVPCSNCTTYIHIYCMEVYKQEIPNNYVCEDCEKKPSYVAAKQLKLAAAKKREEQLKKLEEAAKKREEHLKKLGKRNLVKVLSTNEAIMRLGSGAPATIKVSRAGCSTSGTKHGAQISNASARRNESTTQKFSIVGRAISRPKAPHISVKKKGKRVLETLSNDRVRDEQPGVRENSRSDSVKKPKTILSSAVSPSAPPPPNNNNPGKNLDLKDILPKIQRFLKFAQGVTWRGGIRYSDSSTLIEFGSGFLAKHPCIVHRKAFEHAKKLPSILQIELLPCCNLGKSFRYELPNCNDIALYILPADDVERPKENYSSLFHLMETRKSGMRTFVDGAELLLFTSKQMPVGSRDAMTRFNLRFIYGVFRSMKNKQGPKVCEQAPPSL